MVGAQDGRVSRQVVEVVHDDGDDDVQHDEGAEEDEGDEVEVGHVWAARLVGFDPVAGRLVELVRALVTLPAGDARHHDVRPSFSGGAPETSL